MISMTNAIRRTTSQGYFSLLLLGTAFASIQSAQAQQGYSLTASPASPTTSQAVTITVTTPANFPASGTVPYNVGEDEPQPTNLLFDSVATSNHVGTFVVGPFATPGLYSVNLENSNTSINFNVGGFVPSDALKGQQAFYLSGQERLTAGGSELEAIAGSFNCDGYGHITSGVLDENSGSGLVHVSQLIGTYTLDATTSKGSVTLQLPTGPLSFSFYAQTPLTSYFRTAAIVAGGGSLLSASGQLAPADMSNYLLSDVSSFTVNGENASGGGLVSGIASLQLANAPIVTGHAELIENGAASLYPNITGTATAVDPVTGRFTMSLMGLGSETSKFAVYQGGFSTGGTLFLSLDPHSTAPLLIGTNGSSLSSYVVLHYDTQ